MARRDEQGVRCSFCGKRETQVERMISGPGVYICSDCVRVCSTLLDDDYAPQAARRGAGTSASVRLSWMAQLPASCAFS